MLAIRSAPSAMVPSFDWSPDSKPHPLLFVAIDSPAGAWFHGDRLVPAKSPGARLDGVDRRHTEDTPEASHRSARLGDRWCGHAGGGGRLSHGAGPSPDLITAASPGRGPK